MSERSARSLQPSCLFPDETEVARLILGPKRSRAWKGTAIVLERRGLPKIDPQFGGRYWPAVLAFFDRMYGLDNSEPPRGHH